MIILHENVKYTLEICMYICIMTSSHNTTFIPTKDYSSLEEVFYCCQNSKLFRVYCMIVN